MADLFDFAVATIFAREVLEGALIIGEYRTIILRAGDTCLHSNCSREQALHAIIVSAVLASLVALIICVAIAVPLALLSRNFDDRTSILIEGISKIVAAICILQLSLKIPKWLGVYRSKKQNQHHQKQQYPQPQDEEEEIEGEGGGGGGKQEAKQEAEGASSPSSSSSSSSSQSSQMNNNNSGDETSATTTATTAAYSHSSQGLTLRNIRFNVAWNIWREVAECGVFLIPFFLAGDKIIVIPLSAIVGSLVGLLAGLGIYYANRTFKRTRGLAFFTALLFVVLSAGLFTGGCHNFEKVFGSTLQIWCLQGDFWSVDRLPMTVLKPFGYSDCRTILQILCYWLWLLFCVVLHYRKFQFARKHHVPTNKLSPAPSTAEDANSVAGSIVASEVVQVQQQLQQQHEQQQIVEEGLEKFHNADSAESKTNIMSPSSTMTEGVVEVVVVGDSGTASLS